MAALQEGTLLTVLFPTPVSATVALDVEAALLTILDDQVGPPQFNGKPERVPGALGSENLAHVGQLLATLAAQFEPDRAAVTKPIE